MASRISERLGYPVSNDVRISTENPWLAGTEDE